MASHAQDHKRGRTINRQLIRWPQGHRGGWLAGAIACLPILAVTLLSAPVAVAYLAAGLLVLAGVVLRRPLHAGPWLLLGSGLFALGPSGIVGGEAALALFVIGWLLIAAGAWWFAFSSSHHNVRELVLDCAVVIAAASLIGWLVVLDPVLEEGGEFLLHNLGPAHVTIVVILLGGALAAFDWTVGRRRSPAIALFLSGLAATVGGFALAVGSPFGAPPATLTDGLLAVGALCLGLSALHSTMANVGAPVPLVRTPILSRRFVALVGSGLLPAGVLLLVDGASNDAADFVVVGALSGLITTMVFLRLGLLIRSLGGLIAAQETIAAEQRDITSHDALTGLLSASRFAEEVAIALDADAEGTAIVSCDLDDLGQVQAYGQADSDDVIIDDVIIDAGRRIQLAAGTAGLVGRIAGDQFAVLLRRMEDPAMALQAADRIIAAFGDAQARFAISAGVALGNAALDATALMRQADSAMHEAKRDGKGRAVAYAPALPSVSAARHALRADLARAIDAGELHLEYQPLVELGSGRIRGVEALLRWTHPEHGPIPPVEFVPIAEASGLIIPIGSWVLGEALREVAAMGRNGREIVMSVNVSAIQLRPELVAEVRTALRTARVAPHRLTLELTESILADSDETLDVLNALKGLGIGLSVDDFGTGFSSLSYLARFPVDQLKIDRSFVGMAGDRQLIVTQNVIRLANGLGLETVAEGIEEPWQREQLRSMGCSLGQGYLFARPMRADALRAWIAGDRGVTRPGVAPAKTPAAA